MTNPDDIEEAFYEISRTITAVDRKDRLIILGDFNARVSVDFSSK